MEDYLDGFWTSIRSSCCAACQDFQIGVFFLETAVAVPMRACLHGYCSPDGEPTPCFEATTELLCLKQPSEASLGWVLGLVSGLQA